MELEQLTKKVKTELENRGFDATNSDFGTMVKHAMQTLESTLFTTYKNKKFETEEDALSFVNNEINSAIDNYLYESYGQA